MEKAIYIHGTDESEQSRLTILNQITNKSFVDFLKLDDTSRVLEIGSGLGILATEVAKKVPNGKVVGIEYSREQLAMADDSLPNIEFIPGDAHALPFDDSYFDVVYCRYLLEHVANPARVLVEARRVLKPNGKIFAQENNILVNVLYPECPTFDFVWRKFAVLQKNLGGDALIGKKLLPLLKKAGFRDIELSFAPEIHYSGRATFRPWIENLVGNIRSGQEKLEEHNLATKEDVAKAIAELTNFMENSDSSALFYWNRAAAVK